MTEGRSSIALFNFNKAPAAVFETHARLDEADEAVPYLTAESAPLVAERLSVLQEEGVAEGMSFSAKHGNGFSPLIFGDRDATLPVRAGLMGNVGVVLFFSGLLTAAVAGAALLLGVSGLEHTVAVASIIAAVGAVLVAGDGGR